MKKLILAILLLAMACTEKTTTVVFVERAKDKRPPRCVVPPLPHGKKKVPPVRSDRTPPTGKPSLAPRLYGQATDFKILVLLVDFPDKPFRTAPAYFDRLMFGADSSFKDYYLEVSNGTFNVGSFNPISSGVIIRLPNPYSFYTNGNSGFSGYPTNAQRMAEDAIRLADNSVDFSLYDNDNNGVVDGAIIIHAGSGAELTGSSSDIWSHMWSFPALTVDGKTITDYCTAPEYWVNPGDMKIGVIAHEAGHLYLNQIDEYSVCGKGSGVGRWCLMAGGSYNGISGLGDSPAHLCAQSAKWAGFNVPEVISTPGTYSVVPGQYYRVGSDSEFFGIENRQKVGYDFYLPEGGLLIYHIKPAFQCCGWYPGLNADSCHYYIALEQADGRFDMEKGISSGNNGDPFPGAFNNRTFDSSSIPNSHWYSGYTGRPSGVSITNISNSGSVMTFTLGTSEPPPPPDTLSCPDDILVTCGKKQEGKTVTYTARGYCFPASGSFFPVGVTTVECEVSADTNPDDLVNTLAVCTFTVTVRRTGK